MTRKERLSVQKELLAQILITTYDQPLLIESDDTIGLMDNLEDRQKLLDELESNKLSPEELNEEKTANPELVADIDKLLLAIQLQDKKNEAIAQEKLEDLQKKLRGVQTGKKAVRYEGMAIDAGSMYFEKKG